MSESTKKENTWWQPAVGVFGEITGYIAVPIVAALIAGKKLDARYGTEPWIFLGLAALGFLVTIVGIYKTVRKYGEKLKQIDGNKDEGK